MTNTQAWNYAVGMIYTGSAYIYHYCGGRGQGRNLLEPQQYMEELRHRGRTQAVSVQ